jgi:hypothetical protein
MFMLNDAEGDRAVRQVDPVFDFLVRHRHRRDGRGPI